VPLAPFSFNLSHSGDVALCAIARFATVGVDVEAIRESRDLMPIARRFFSFAEQAALQALPSEQQCLAFYQCWSSKEALLKAWGTGLATPLDQFNVRVAPGEAALLSIDIPEWARTPWRLYPVAVPDGYAATLALPGPATALKCFHWPSSRRPEPPLDGTSRPG
jgi:4'-phosphopantetheinyl transferase